MANNKSFQLLRTNPALTGNVKVVVSSEYQLFLESYNSNDKLSQNRFKHFIFNKDNYYDVLVSNFFKDIGKDIVFDVLNKEDEDSDIMYSKYINQFSPIYFAGGGNIQDQWYKEEFEYTAPLYIKPEELPDGFVVLRVDEPAIFNEKTGYVLDGVNKDNFREEIIDKWKLVSLVDMTPNTDLGAWVQKNFVENKNYPTNSFEFDGSLVDSPTWIGLVYENGYWGSRKSFLKDILDYDQPHFKLEKYINDGFQNNGVIYPHIVNFNFLFDDTPANPFELKKWGINRYYGFYIDQLDLITNLTSYTPPNITTGVTIINNIFVSVDDFKQSVYPFVEEFNSNKEYYIYAKDDLHKVQRTLENGEEVYKILSTIELSIDDINKDGIVDINYIPNKRISYENTLTGRFDNLEIDPYIKKDNTREGLYGDLYLIKIQDKYHVLKYRNNLDSQNFPSGGTIFQNTGETNDIVGNKEYLFVASNSGITVYNWEGDILLEVTAENSDLPSNIVNSLYLSDDILYAGTDEGIWFKIFTNFTLIGNNIINTTNSNIPCNKVNKIYYNEYIVAGCYNSTTSTNSWWINNESSLSGYTKEMVSGDIPNSFSIDKTNLYVAESKTIRKYFDFNPDTFLEFSNTTNILLPDATINDLVVEDDILYVATDGGFWLKNGPFERIFNTDNDIDLGSDMIKRIQVNSTAGVVYLTINSEGAETGTDGVYFLNYFNNELESYTNSGNGILEQPNNVVVFTDDEEISIAGIDGFQIFNLPVNVSSSTFNYFEYYLNTDYAINSNSDLLEYWIQDKNSPFYTSTPTNITPIQYPIYRLKFSDIKDFDFDRVDTNYANYDYLQDNEYSNTEEHKLYAINYNDNALKRDWRRYKTGKDKGKVMNISSEYVSDDELWELNEDGHPVDVWSINPTISKWGYVDSISHSDYPYKLNNSYKIGSLYNRGVGIYESIPSIKMKNLDYFYRVGELTTNDGQDGKFFYHQSRNIETCLLNTDSVKFNIDLYLENTFDYFDYFFDNYMNQRINNDDNNLKSTQKYSIFNNGDKYKPASTILNGLNYEIIDVEDIVYDRYEDNELYVKEIIRKENDVNYNKYKCSIIFNPAYEYQTTSGIIENVSIKPLVWYNPIYLQGYDFFFDPLVPPVRGFDYGLKNNIDLTFLSYSALTFFIDEEVNVREIWEEKYKNDDRQAEILELKQSGRLFLKIESSSTAVTYLSGQTFTDTDLRNDYVIFSGDTYFTGETSDITKGIIPNDEFIGVFTGTSDVYVSLTEWDEDDFLTNYVNWITNSSLYQVENYLSNGGVRDTNEIINNTKIGIDVILNNVYNNCLIIVNYPITIKDEYLNLNNYDVFRENYGLYYNVTFSDKQIFDSGLTNNYNYNAENITALNFSKTINKLVENEGFETLTYHYIDTDNSYRKYEMTGETLSPFVLQINAPIKMETKKYSYDVIPIRGPSYDIYNYNGDIITEPLSRIFIRNDEELKLLPVQNGVEQVPYNIVYRYNGYYEPIFKRISIFNKIDYFCDCDTNERIIYDNNYRFEDDYTNFGKIDELVYSKVNEEGSVLKLKDVKGDSSVYPMVDEFGYSVTDRFIFKSTWDSDFFIKTNKNIS
jgi:hypothetical protein